MSGVAGEASVRGRLVRNASLADITWFRVGGPADILFEPADTEDLADFLRDSPAETPVIAIGLGSNLLVRDGGFRGAVIRLGKPFQTIAREGDARLRVGAGARDAAAAKAAREAGLSGLEFLIGVPGTIGGALRMNAGAYGAETSDSLVEATYVTRAGEIITKARDALGFGYRTCGAPEDAIFVEAVFEGRPGDKATIGAKMREITQAREATQPIKERTGGSTFKNPDPDGSGRRKAWRLIESVGGRGRVRGDAQVSERHCNFLINRGSATAQDIESLGESLRADVEAQTGVDLHWEIRRIGEKA